MIMDTLDSLPNQHHHHHHHHHATAYLLTESAAAAAAAAHHFNVISFDTCLYKTEGSISGGSPTPASVCSPADDPSPSEAQPGDLNTPVTTSSDIPSFFGPSTVIEPPPITGLTPNTFTPHLQQLGLEEKLHKIFQKSLILKTCSIED
nr:unnamed protein product [Callosobruchus analis]